ncbi:N4-(beta-N-acetylglucosaminyl)-L-asparaginase [Zhouia amylolytica]|uniref:Glycosylasparaginase beta chain n=2 Tax=Zhouia amylolytica TaxID=376730 RepID=W2UK14_9FLAO|nr:N(4)-(beta-N-acetylglucosaminyl)-L-asparaginase [Zhouia amylolytica]ETN94319.1 glycosylasparaginase beta chain [Zhouia amylolytica AD3]MCQ0110451.1 N(4)-(beta-N-acetylglucosaminyl)-L-asparaginase [Zhouia amylolytica]SFT15463.1 N4-(beta-N-acetylglucosaminyl)-L-asparaginase [Zhouia amylolytica]
MINRRKFITNAALSTAAIGTLSACVDNGYPGTAKKDNSPKKVKKPVIISTWNHGMPANEEAWKILGKGGSALDAVEAGVKTAEANPDEMSVGYGGLPDREGKVTLDACIMDHNSRAGSVAFLQDIMHPVSVARKVMEETPHVMLVGEGAKQFALEQGFKEQDLLTEKAKKAYENWLKKSEYKPVINIENHDTISSLALDENGNLSGACTTSGAAWKMHGRVGDSPIIGAGLFLDNEVGGAAATGLGEAVIRTAGSAMVVELMRQGKSPAEACKEIVERIYNLHRNQPEFDYLQVGFIALNKHGEYGGYCLRKGFNYAVYDKEEGSRLIDAEFKI